MPQEQVQWVLTLAVLTQQLDQAVSNVRPTDASALQRLKSKAAHNATLLDAARRRLEDARRATQGLQTYDGQGRRYDVTNSGITAGRF